MALHVDRDVGRGVRAVRVMLETDSRQDTNGRTERVAPTRGSGRRRAEPELEAFLVAIRARQTVYNTIRPHQALGYLTPAEYLASVGVDL